MVPVNSRHSYLISFSLLVTCTSPFVSDYFDIHHKLSPQLIRLTYPPVLEDPQNVDAAAGLVKCMSFLKRMEGIWTNASRYWSILHTWNVYLYNAEERRHHQSQPGATKRPAEDEFHFRRPAPAHPRENIDKSRSSSTASTVPARGPLAGDLRGSSGGVLSYDVLHHLDRKDPWSTLPGQELMSFGGSKDTSHTFSIGNDRLLDERSLLGHGGFDSNWMETADSTIPSVPLFGIPSMGTTHQSGIESGNTVHGVEINDFAYGANNLLLLFCPCLDGAHRYLVSCIEFENGDQYWMR